VLFVPVPSPSEKGWLGGGSAGCNWQSRQWVFGIEADVDGANISGNQTTIGPSVTAVLGVAQNTYQIGPGTQTAAAGVLGTANEQVSLRWLSTVRGRLGFAVQDRLLLFATGGLAVGGASTQGSVGVGLPPANTFLWSGSNSATMIGYAIGGGAEWAFSGHWTAKAEYLWYDLGTISHPLNCMSGALCGTLTLYPTLGNTRLSVAGSILRLGINYKFN
jgi:outer membrane immunogenic protein